MNKTLKRVICICLCTVLMFGVFTAPIVQPKADAFAITATAGMIAIGVTLLTMLGITFASVGAAEQASKSLLEGSQDIFDWVNDLSLQGGSGGEPGDGKWFKLGATTMAGLATFVNKARELFGNSANSGSVQTVDTTTVNLGGLTVYSSVNGFSNEELFAIAPYRAGAITSIVLNGVRLEYDLRVDSSGTCAYVYKNNRTILVDGLAVGLRAGTYYTGTKFDFRYGHYTYLYDGEIYLNQFVAYKATEPDGDVYYDAYHADCVYDRGATNITTEYLAPVYTDTYYQNISPYELNILYNALAEKLQTQEITFDYTDTLDQIENHSEEQLQVSQDQLLEQAQIKDLLEQIKAGQGGTTKTELQEKDLNIPETHNLTWKFPFCVPFDLIALVGALNATPKDPKWEIPFHIESLGFDDLITLDLTTFEPVTVVLRVVTTIAFLLGLIIVTRKMIQG